MTFSWAQTLHNSLELKIRQAKTLAINQDTQYKKNYPAESREANEGKYMTLKLRLTKDHNDNIRMVRERRARMLS